MSERKQWKEHHHEGLARAIENLLHAAGCPTADVNYHNSHGLTVVISFDDHCTDGAILWAIGAHGQTEGDGG